MVMILAVKELYWAFVPELNRVAELLAAEVPHS